MHFSQPASHLFGRPALFEQGTHAFKQGRIHPQPERSTTPATPCRPHGAARIVVFANRIASQFACHRRGRPLELPGNCPATQSGIPALMNDVALICAQVCVAPSHLDTLSERGVALHFRARHFYLERFRNPSKEPFDNYMTHSVKQMFEGQTDEQIAGELAQMMFRQEQQTQDGDMFMFYSFPERLFL